MNTGTRILALVILIITSAARAEAAPDAVGIEPAVAPLTVVGATAAQQQTLVDALALFEQAGLELPPLVVEYAAGVEACNGHAGLFRTETAQQPATITICHRLPLLLVHELAHAWDHHNLTDETRQRFLDRWDLERWNDHTDDWYHRGTEKAAHTIAYGLTLETPTDSPDILQFVCGYELLTGNPLPNHGLVDCPEMDIAT